MGELLGGKGAGLAEMTHIGLPVPPGFTVTTRACNEYGRRGREYPPGLSTQIEEALTRLERETGKSFGGEENPLLLSVRSGAVKSMPGMMDTVLNLGLNPTTTESLARATGDRRFALDCYRRLIQMFSDVCMGVDHHLFEDALSQKRRAAGAANDSELSADHLESLIEKYRAIYRGRTGEDFPDDPRQQLDLSIRAVFNSWNNDRAIVYRRHYGIADNLGTGANVQMMVFGNMGPDSGTGVLFTRNPSTGSPELYGEYLPNAQGEDVVAGTRTPRTIAQLDEEMPEIYQGLCQSARLLEDHYRDMQDIEFTFERGRLFILQTRAGKRTARAQVRIANDLVKEGILDIPGALSSLEVRGMSGLLHRNVDLEYRGTPLATGLPASPGAAMGICVFTADEAEELGQAGEKVILVRPETTPDDIHGMLHAQGILTSRGGMTCHAAIVARGWGKPCIVGCGALSIDPGRSQVEVAGRTLTRGDLISIDGASGAIYLGEVPMVEPEMGEELGEILSWADRYRKLGVRANADTPEDAQRARDLGAEGIGLCRTEHMFMGQDRLPVVQRMILASSLDERKKALLELLPMQEDDFYRILKVMEGLPVTIRLLDPPLHEFLPDIEDLVEEVTRLSVTGSDPDLLADRESLLRKVRSLREFNPMLGHRGCRVGIVYPEIYEMQAEAIFRAASRLVKEGVQVEPEIMIPLVTEPRELEQLAERVRAIAQRVTGKTPVPYSLGTMIEVPRACLLAGEVAAHAQFFSFGTNDLTQTTFGFSRDDAEAKFLHRYIQDRILDENPFAVLDGDGVGKLMELATREGRQARPGLKVGICGEHGGEPASIALCHKMGLDYVSCSPFRVPVARLAAAQAALNDGIKC